MVRAATEQDIPRLVALVAAFHAEPRWPGPLSFKAEDFAQTCQALLASGGAVFLSDGGLIGLTVNPSLYNHAVKVASELFFWAPDGRGDALRQAAEAWAKDRACLLVMSAHEPGPVARIANWYRRKGYQPIGRQFAKVL